MCRPPLATRAPRVPVRFPGSGHPRCHPPAAPARAAPRPPAARTLRVSGRTRAAAGRAGRPPGSARGGRRSACAGSGRRSAPGSPRSRRARPCPPGPGGPRAARARRRRRARAQRPRGARAEPAKSLSLSRKAALRHHRRRPFPEENQQHPGAGQAPRATRQRLRRKTPGTTSTTTSQTNPCRAGLQWAMAARRLRPRLQRSRLRRLGTAIPSCPMALTWSTQRLPHPTGLGAGHGARLPSRLRPPP